MLEMKYTAFRQSQPSLLISQKFRADRLINSKNLWDEFQKLVLTSISPQKQLTLYISTYRVCVNLFIALE